MERENILSNLSNIDLNALKNNLDKLNKYKQYYISYSGFYHIINGIIKSSEQSYCESRIIFPWYIFYIKRNSIILHNIYSNKYTSYNVFIQSLCDCFFDIGNICQISNDQLKNSFSEMKQLILIKENNNCENGFETPIIFNNNTFESNSIV